MLYKYLLEIKYRILFSFISWCFIILNCYYFKETLLYVFIKFSMTSNDSNLLCFLTTDVIEIFSAYIQLSLTIASQMTIIFTYCQICAFLSAGLRVFEYDYLKTVVKVVIVCWTGSIYALNSFIFPVSWDFFFKFQEFSSFQNLTFYFEAKLNEYLAFYKSLYYLFISLCQIMILFFIFLELFKTNLFYVKKFRKTCYFILFILSTLLTPPEVIYQVMVSLCSILFYEAITVCTIFKTELLIK